MTDTTSVSSVSEGGPSMRARRQPTRWILIATLVTLVGLGLGTAAKASGVRPVRITSGSMLPTVGVGEWVIVTDASTARWGDIIEFAYPTGSTGRAIKRVLALGGDVVELTDNGIIVNGVVTPLDGEPVEFERRRITVPDGYLYLLGDNHAGSYDSRGFGPVPASDVVGRVRTTIPNPKTLALWTAGLAGAVLLLPVAIRGRSTRSPAGARTDRSKVRNKQAHLTAARV